MTNETEAINGVGDTALWTAASRARESRRPDRLFSDPLAGVLAGPKGVELLKHFHTSRASDEGNPFLPIRTRWFDDYLETWVGEGHQVVGLAAGLDTRAFRLEWPDGVTLYEVDQKAVLAYKESTLAAAGAKRGVDTRTVPVDLGDDWPAALRAAGFDPAKPTVWFAEGLLFYLPEALAHRVVRDAAALSAPGSVLAADLIGTGIFRFPYTREFLRRLEAADSPWVFGTDDPARFLTDCGWDPIDVTEPGKANANYGRWPEAASPANLPDLPRSHLVAGRLA
ncbi:class I SAM-dependent methyltransferase [Amycolatopsis sp. H20-H5]|uniref:class I SAM-dependent methyltransferase n=1 Tax=Amycolatopsis sp. H20-H5 TaxID=3046309 RepID=UPI002DBCADDD|nr:SAM-dependent methyltransferase [Amycolatopsis sp. H20-H5]MEC3976892.1 SAM-dependent methyltransferase [Amycolatopsis sp. H20-H5]